MKAYLEKCDKEWFDDFVYMSKQPLLDRGIQVVPFDGTFLDDFIERTVFDKNDIVIGSVEATKAFWEAAGITAPSYIGYPKALTFALHRDIWVSKFSDLKNADFPLFIKPKNDVKLFTGFVIENEKSYNNCKLLYSEITDDLELYVSKPLNIQSEYRCFVHKGQLVGLKHYSGDFTRFPNPRDIKHMISEYELSMEAPVSYTLDVGVCNFGKWKEVTTLIEVNDFWAIGSYGLDGKTYIKMLIDRFQEIKSK